MPGIHISPPDLHALLAPVLPALPSATISTEPAVGVLPLLSPILRQRVQLFSDTSNEPWLRLLCYDSGNAVKLAEIARSGSLEPHPVSGEVEIDWDYDAQTRYKRKDQETLQAFTVLSEIGLAFQLIYCLNDVEGGGDGWRIGEVTVAERPSPFGHFGGVSSISEAESLFQAAQTSRAASTQSSRLKVNGTYAQLSAGPANGDEEEDDGYWDRYDASPARTPANNRSPAPPKGSNAQSQSYQTADDDDDDDYYAQYDDVQPAMDNHDPDEEIQLPNYEPPLGMGSVEKAMASSITAESNETRSSWTFAELDKSHLDSHDHQDSKANDVLLHPRPESSASSNGSRTVAKLEASADKQEQNEFGIKQHVSRSIRSLWLLSRSSGISREEFELMVQREIDVLGMYADQD